LARPTEPANFARDLGYNAAADMFFPAGIPLAAVVALIIWNTHQEAKHGKSSRQTKSH
jgi:hypothetical protein